MSASKGATLVAERCELAGIQVEVDAGPGGAPLLRPPSEDALADFLAGAAEAGSFAGSAAPRLAPVGLGSSMDWCRPGQASRDGGTHFVSMRSLVEASGTTGIVEYVPGDGTLTALAGAAVADLRAAVREGGHRITPAVHGASTIGGVLAAGRSGPDRIAFGPGRHHVLGMRTVDGAGRRARSGGRLVKNVTGFDLHRLHVGARGTLGFILEVSLRLVPAPEAEVLVVSPRAASATEAVSLALAVRADRRIRPRMLFVKDRCVHVVLAGRSAQVDAERRAWEGHSGTSSALEGEAVEERALSLASRDIGLRVHTVPSAVEAVVRALESGAEGTRELVVEPDAALVDVPREALSGATPASAAALLTALEGHGARVEARGALSRPLDDALASRDGLSGPPRAWTQRLVDAFDPAGLLAIDGFPRGL